MTNYTSEYDYRGYGTYTTIPNIHLALKLLTPSEFRVYAALATFAQDSKNPGVAFPKQQKLAALMDLSRQQVNQTLKGLVQKGFIEHKPRLKYGPKRENIYRIRAIEPPAPHASKKRSQFDNYSDY